MKAVPGCLALFRLYLHQRQAEEMELGRLLFVAVDAVRKRKGGGGPTVALRFLVVHWVLREQYKVACVNPESQMVSWLNGDIGTSIDYLLANKEPTKAT